MRYALAVAAVAGIAIGCDRSGTGSEPPTPATTPDPSAIPPEPKDEIKGGTPSMPKEDGDKSVTPLAEVKDPVCGMKVDKETTKWKTTVKDVEYFFCSEECMKEFLADTSKYGVTP